MILILAEKIPQASLILPKVKQQMSTTSEKLYIAAGRDGDITEVISLLAQGVSINSVYGSSTALMGAAVYGRDEIISFLLERGADITVQNSTGWTALMVAAKEGKERAVSLLLCSGADPLVKDTYGRTALDRAKIMNKHGVVKIIEKYLRQVNVAIFTLGILMLTIIDQLFNSESQLEICKRSSLVVISSRI